MTKINIKREVISVIEEMGIPRKAITERASFYKDLGLDSLDFIEMVMQFEVRFNLNIPSIEAEDIHTVRGAIDYLKSALRA